MSKKDYELMARAISAVRQAAFGSEAPDEVLDAVSSILARGLAEDNSRFDSDKFLKACGVNQ